MTYTILVKNREPYLARIPGNSKLRASSTCSLLSAAEACARKLTHACGAPYVPDRLRRTGDADLDHDYTYTYTL